MPNLTTTSFNTEPSGPVILRNRTKSGTLLATLNMQSTPSNDFITVILRNQDGITTVETENNNNLPTEEEVRMEGVEWKASIKKANGEENSHAGMSWIECHDDECLVHMSEKTEVGGSRENQNNNHRWHHTPTYNEISATDGDAKSQHTK